jgi:hypothetical protein
MTENRFPIGQRVNLPGHFHEPVVLEAVRQIGSGYECRVRLLDGTPEEAILSPDEVTALIGQSADAVTKISVCTRGGADLRADPDAVRVRTSPSEVAELDVALHTFCDIEAENRGALRFKAADLPNSSPNVAVKSEA